MRVDAVDSLLHITQLSLWLWDNHRNKGIYSETLLAKIDNILFILLLYYLPQITCINYYHIQYV